MRRPTRAEAMRRRIQQWLLLIVSPVAIALLANVSIALATGQSVASWMWYVVGVAAIVWSACVLAAYTKAFERPLSALAELRRRSRFRKARVWVLDGRLTEEGPATTPAEWTNRRPDDWIRALKAKDSAWNVKLAPVIEVLEEHPEVVVNPFGEVYPEEDFTLHTTLTQIRDYVAAGGVYVNVAGYPFWFKYNPDSKQKVEAGRWEQAAPNLMLLRPLLGDPLLAISPVIPGPSQLAPTKQTRDERDRFGEIAGAGRNPNVKMFRQYPMAVQQMVPMLRSDDDQFIVIGAIPYGRGYFVFCGVEIDNKSSAFEKVVEAIVGWVNYERMGRP